VSDETAIATEYDVGAFIQVGKLEAEIEKLVRRKSAILKNVERRQKELTPEDRLASVHLRASRRFGRDIRREWKLSNIARALLEILVDVRKRFRSRGGDLGDGVPATLEALGKALGRCRKSGAPYGSAWVIRTLDELEALHYIERKQERKGNRMGRLRIWIPPLDLLERNEAERSV
jgi:hypothetical protein